MTYKDITKRKTEILHVRLTERQAKYIKGLSKHHKMSTSALVSYLIFLGCGRWRTKELDHLIEAHIKQDKQNRDWETVTNETGDTEPKHLSSGGSDA